VGARGSEGAVVAIDGKAVRRSSDAASACPAIKAAAVPRREADYVLALKGNHGLLHERVEQFLSSVREGRTHGFEVGQHRSVEKEHGRVEERRFWQVEAPADLTQAGEWVGLQAVGRYSAGGAPLKACKDEVKKAGKKRAA
jgi:hypothetical protein